MNSIIKIKEQIKRENDIDNILKKFIEKDIPDNIIHKINKLYPVTTEMNFLRTEQLEVGMIIKVVTIDLKKILSTAIILKLISNSSQKIGVLMLLNPANKSIWQIKPDKYYIFQAEEGVLTSYKLKNDIKKINYKN